MGPADVHWPLSEAVQRVRIESQELYHTNVMEIGKLNYQIQTNKDKERNVMLVSHFVTLIFHAHHNLYNNIHSV